MGFAITHLDKLGGESGGFEGTGKYLAPTAPDRRNCDHERGRRTAQSFRDKLSGACKRTMFDDRFVIAGLSFDWDAEHWTFIITSAAGLLEQVLCAAQSWNDPIRGGTIPAHAS